MDSDPSQITICFDAVFHEKIELGKGPKNFTTEFTIVISNNAISIPSNFHHVLKKLKR